MTLRELLENVKLSADDNIVIYTKCSYESEGGYHSFEDVVYDRHGGYSIYETLDKEYLNYKIHSINTTSDGKLKILIKKESD